MKTTMDVLGWLVTGSAGFPDMACTSEQEADNCLFVRNDSTSYKIPMMSAELGNHLYRSLSDSQALMTVILRVQHDGPAFHVLTKRLAKQIEANAALFRMFGGAIPPAGTSSPSPGIHALIRQLQVIHDRQVGNTELSNPTSAEDPLTMQTQDITPLVSMLRRILQLKHDATK